MIFKSGIGLVTDKYTRLMGTMNHDLRLLSSLAYAAKLPTKEHNCTAVLPECTLNSN